MRIALDIRKFHDFGIGTYIRNLLAFLEIQSGHELLLVASPELSEKVRPSPNSRIVVNSSPKYSVRELFTVSREVNRKGYDLFHAPHYTYPYGIREKGVVTIHDLIHLRFPQHFSRGQRLYARAIIGHACRSADAVVVDSEFTKKDLLKTFRIPEEKIHTIHLGVGSMYRPSEAPTELGASHTALGITRPYILYVGSLKPHKNVPLLLKAFGQIRRDVDVQLVLAGEKLDAYPELRVLRDRLMLGRDMVVAAGTNQTDLISLYQHASALVMPSLYEGFGLPLVEAMACGVPVVGSRATSIPEVVGDAGVLIDPFDVGDLASALLRVLNDEGLRETLRVCGLHRASQFTWERCGEKTLQLYELVVGSR
jgi:glycosyltransferase involved in cell wall biosynthesis